MVPFLLNYCSYSFFRFGFIGNQPFSTRSRCSKTSLMVQKEENEKTPNRVDSRQQGRQQNLTYQYVIDDLYFSNLSYYGQKAAGALK